MPTEDCKELLTSGQPENVGSDFYDDANIKATTAGEKKGEDFLTALEDDKTDGRGKNEGVKNDKKAEEVKLNAAVTPTVSKMTELSTTVIDGHENADVESDKKAEAVNSSSNKETKKIVRKRKNAEETSAHTASSPPKMIKKKMNDMSAKKMKEVSSLDTSMEGNETNEVKSDEKLESIVKGAIPEDEKKEADMTDVKVVKKVEGIVNKTNKIVKKKIVAKAKGGRSKTEPAPTKSENVAAVAATSGMDESAKQNVEIDENLASEAKNVIPAVEKKDVEATKGNSNETETLDEKDTNIKKREKKVAISSTSINADKVNDADKPSPSAGEKRSKMADAAEKRSKQVDGMGLIFMCNAKTKKDCFKYNILGLPESKKELVAKIYKGMRLFLFDFDLKLLYGIYKAASPGGYNIEPKAFDSKFPAQVRFIVIRDCLPLPEEKFQAAIRENYYKRSKFNCELSPEQVRNLCKLFQSATSNTSQKNHRGGTGREATMQSSRASGLKRRHVGRFHPRNDEIYGREAYPSPPPRVRYLSPPPRALPLHPFRRALPPSTLPSYARELPADDYYRRDHHRVLDLEMRPRDPPIDYQDPYILYREPGLYREPLYPPSLPAAYAPRLREPRSPPRYPY